MTLLTSPWACCYTTLGNYKFKLSADVEENINKLHFLIASNFVILPQILIFSVFKIARLSLYWLQIKLPMSVFFYLFTFAINLWLEIRRSTETSLQCLTAINMVFSDEDEIFIKSLYLKGYTAKRGWQTYFLRKAGQSVVLISCWKIQVAGHRHSWQTARQRQTVQCPHWRKRWAVSDLLLSQEDKPQAHRAVREISRETDIPWSSMSRTICKDLWLKCFKRRRAQKLTDANCAARMKRAKLLLQKFP